MAKKEKKVKTKGQNNGKLSTVKRKITTTKSGKPRKKRYILLIFILMVLIFISLCGLLFCLYIMLSAPDFDVNMLYKKRLFFFFFIK